MTVELVIIKTKKNSMKSNLFLEALLVATAFTFGSCSSDNNENAPDVGEKIAQVQLTIKGSAGTSKKPLKQLIIRLFGGFSFLEGRK